MNDIIETFKYLQSFCDQVSALSVFYYPVNFAVSFFVSIISFLFFLEKVSTSDDLLKFSRNIQEISQKNKVYFIFYIFLYGTITGLLSTAIIKLQISKTSIPTAILYGVLGPYFLKETVTASFKSRSLRNTNKAVDSIKEESEKEYETFIKNVKGELQKSIKTLKDKDIDKQDEK